MIYGTLDGFNNRYQPINPMPDLKKAVKAAVDAMEMADYCMEKVLEECSETLQYGYEMSEKYKDGELEGWSDMDIAKLDGECQCATRIAKALGYEVDYWFCSWPKFKPVERKENGDD